MTPPQDSVSDVERLRAAWETIKREFGQYMEDGWNGQYPEVADMDAAVAALAVPINKIGEDAK